MRPLGCAALILFAASAGPVRADAAWTCTYAAADGGGARQIRYRAAGNEFIESDRNERFRIVQDGEQRLVATSAAAEAGPKQDQPAGATTLVLDKKTGAFMLSSENAGPTGIMTPPVRGTCVQG
jgi:hypothetical protein